MSDQQKRKRDATANEANKRTRSADGGIIHRLEDMTANWLQAPVAKTRHEIAAARRRDDRPLALYQTASVNLDLDELIQTKLSKGRFGSVQEWRAMALTTSTPKQHKQWRIEKDWNEHYYVLVGDGLMDDAEVEIVSVKSQKRWKWSISNLCEILHYLTIGLITEEELSSPWRAQPELLRALSPAWLQGFQDDIAAAGDMEDSDSGLDDDEAARELLATGYDPDDDIVELPSMPVWI